MLSLAYRVAFALGFVVCLLAAPALAQVADANADDAQPIDWPTFQYNNARTGHSEHPPIHRPAINWSTQLGIMGYLNCPVIDGDRVFVTSSGDRHNEADPSDGVYCLSLDTGEILWHYLTPSDACGISIDRDHVYVGDDRGVLHAIDRATGDLSWHTEPSEGLFAVSIYSQPLLIGGMVLADNGFGRVFAYDCATGEVRWSYPADGDQGLGVIRGGISSDGEHIYANFLHGHIACLTQGGRVAWSQDCEDWLSNFDNMYPAPTVADGFVYNAYARDTVYRSPALICHSVHGRNEWGDLSSNAQRYGGRGFGNIRSSPAVYADTLIYAEPYGNDLIWIDRTTARLEHKLDVGASMFPHWPSPVIATDVLYLARHDGGLYAIDLEGRVEQWMIYLGDHTQAGRTDLPDDIYPPRTYGTEWDPNVGKPLYATPAIARDGRIVIGTGDGWLYCIGEAQ